MLHQIYRDTHRVRHLLAEPLGAHICAFVDSELDQGFARLTLHGHLRALGKLNHWLARRDVSAAELSAAQLQRFVSRAGWRPGFRRHALDVLSRFLRHLQLKGVAKAERILRPKGARHVLLDEFRQYLRTQRGLSKWTITHYTYEINSFLKRSERSGRLLLRQLRPTDIYRHVIDAAHRNGGREARGMVTALRSFFRWLHFRGIVSGALSAAVPTVAEWKLSSVPVVLTPDEITRVLQSCNLRTAKGKRDRAILLLLAKLGLRAGEVVALRLGDLDWKAGIVRVRRKGGRADSLPLPPAVGTAVVDYVLNVRPRCSETRVFLCLVAPHRGLGHSSTVSSIVAAALRRAGLKPARCGAHIFRHSLASSLLRRGASLSEIGQLLGHRAQASTEVYAKVDIAGLRSVAQAWPGGMR